MTNKLQIVFEQPIFFFNISKKRPNDERFSEIQKNNIELLSMSALKNNVCTVEFPV
jgi:hypothetical protein